MPLPKQYPPSGMVSGFEYWSIISILYMLINECPLENVKVLCAEALNERASGRRLRNDYILKIRAAMQEWHSASMVNTNSNISRMVKPMLTRFLEVTAEKNFRGMNQISLTTYIVYDLNKRCQAPVILGKI